MSFKKFRSKTVSASAFFGAPFLVFTLVLQARAQTAADEGGNGWFYVGVVVVLLLAAVGVFYWRGNAKKIAGGAAAAKPSENPQDAGAVDGDKELEWLRKNQQLIGKKSDQQKATRKKPKKERHAAPLKMPATENMLDSSDIASEIAAVGNASVVKTAAAPLPIFSVQRLEPARPFDQLPISADEDLMSAIEQTQDEMEEDEEIRDLAVRVLTMFRSRNAVEALAQIALYDLSAALRSKAVSVLSEFDHESVFEAILLANADPTREVRAAAARGLTKLTFDRADAWTRIAEAEEPGRIAQSARAAVESGFVERSFDRLVSPDYKQAYEAFALMTLLIRAGETEKIFGALETHRDTNVRRAILHTLRASQDRSAADELARRLEKNNLPFELQAEAERAIEEIALVAA